MYRITTHSPEETLRLGRWLGRRLRSGDFIALIGELGAGKTALSGGILAGLGVERTGGSPTFTLLWEYPAARTPVYHWDVYRLRSPAEMEDLGYDEYFFGPGVNIVEWADRIEPLWPPDHLRIELGYGAGEDDRTVAITGTDRFRTLLEELANADFGA